MSRQDRTTIRRKNYRAWKQEQELQKSAAAAPSKPSAAAPTGKERKVTAVPDTTAGSFDPAALLKLLRFGGPEITTRQHIALAHRLEEFAALPESFPDAEQDRRNFVDDIKYALDKRGIPWPAEESDSPLLAPGRATGPRTLEGLARSSQNARKHGLTSLTSSFVTLPGEDPHEWDQLFSDLLVEFRPASRTERILVTDMAQSHWLTQRAIHLQTKVIDDPKVLTLYLRYQTTHQRAYYRALQQLLALQKSRAQSKPSVAAPSAIQDSRPTAHNTPATAQTQPATALAVNQQPQAA